MEITFRSRPKKGLFVFMDFDELKINLVTTHLLPCDHVLSANTEELLFLWLTAPAINSGMFKGGCDCLGKTPVSNAIL